LHSLDHRFGILSLDKMSDAAQHLTLVFAREVFLFPFGCLRKRRTVLSA
jgi:hypothetical protein